MCNKVLSRDKLNKNPTPLLCNQEVLSQNKRKGVLPRPSLIQEKWGSGYQISTRLNIVDTSATEIRRKYKVLGWAITIQIYLTCVQRFLLGSRWLMCSLWGAQGTAPGCTGVWGWFLPPASLRSLSCRGPGESYTRSHQTDAYRLRVKNLFHRHGGLQEPHEQTAAAPEHHQWEQMHQATRPVSQAQTCALVTRGWPQHSHKMLLGSTRVS